MTKSVAAPIKPSKLNGSAQPTLKATGKTTGKPATVTSPAKGIVVKAAVGKTAVTKAGAAKSAPTPVAPAIVPATGGKRGKAVVKVSLGARTEPIRISVSSELKNLPPKTAEIKSAKASAAGNRFPQNLPVPQAPVPTNGKPRRNLAGLNTRDLEHFRELLLAKRRELVGDMSAMEREALRSANSTNLSNLPLHMADQGTDNYEQEFTLGLVEKDRNLLREINRGLAKIQDGTYGICEGTGKPISKPRLEAQPWAKFSIEHARQLERGMMIRR